jgi:hypothetical protein
MSYVGVNAHHQNGIAERKIRELQELARTILIHANARWSDSVTATLWPYAIRMANEAVNHTPSFQDREKRSPIELSTRSSIPSNPKHWKPFGCPTYVLIMSCRAANHSTNGINAQSQESIWAHRHYMEGMWR